tara:strand:+ start:498 stop:1337 length:840 start_codon:yes stop_codon:yes gene_type:complete
MKAIILNLLAWPMLAIMDGFAKYLSYSLPILQITWSRYFFTVLIALPIMIFFFKKNFKFPKDPKLQIVRGFLLFFANILFFYSISVIPLAKSLTLAFIAPLIVTLLSPILLKEKVGIKRWAAVVIGFIGSLVVLRPGFMEVNLASLAALGTGILYGLYLIVTRKLNKSEHPLLTLLLTGIVGGVIGSILIPSVWVQPSISEWYMMFAIGLFATIGHFLLILSLVYADASKLAPFGYFEIIPNMIIGYIFFNNLPDHFHFLGLLIIISSGIYIFKRETSS